MKVVNSDNFFDLQKLSVSVDTFSYSSRYVLVTVNPKVKFICQLCQRRNINSSYCVLDKSVVNIVDFYNLTLPVNFDRLTDYEELNVNNVTEIDDINALQNVAVTVVFKNAHLTSAWKSKTAILRTLVKESLKLFVVSKNSLVFVKNVSACANAGIYCICVRVSDHEYGRVVSNTNVIIDNVMSKNWIQSENLVQCIAGLSSSFERLRDYCMLELKRRSIEFQSTHSNNVLLTGPAGCGKKTVVRHLVSECGFPLLTISGPEVCNPQPGATEQAINSVFEQAKLLATENISGVCVLLLDQVESLAAKNSSTHAQRVQAALLKSLDAVVRQPGVFVVATTSKPYLLTTAFRRPPRFTHELAIDVPTETERVEMILALCKEFRLIMKNIACFNVAQWTPGFVAADLKLLASDVIREFAKRTPGTVSDDVRDLNVWLTCAMRMQPSTLRGELAVVTHSDTKMSDIGGMEQVKKTLASAIQWPFTHHEAFTRLGITPTKGILLYGPPGCAKTSLVRAIANDMQTTFLAISAASLYSPYVGEAERTVMQLFHRARLGSPTVLFIDEIDALLGSRGNDSRESGAHERVLSTFLVEMDGFGSSCYQFTRTGPQKPSVVVVAATNQPQLLDSALLRPGRFDRLIYVGPSDRDGRLDILVKMTNKIPIGESIDLNHIADITSLYSGADLARLCKEAVLYAMTKEGMDVKRVEQHHFLHAVDNMKPSLTKEQIQFYENFQFN